MFFEHPNLLDCGHMGSQMTKRSDTKFDETLSDLFKDRTHWLRAQIRTPHGIPPEFNKEKIQKAIKELQSFATESLIYEHAFRSLSKLYDQKRQWHVKGWGREEQRENFTHWLEKEISFKNFVYVFWSNKRCRYVGRTIGGKNRPQSHFEKYWFTGVTRIDVLASRAKREIPKLECLASHRFKPSKAKNKPSSLKWYTPCPICETQEAIRDEMRSIFKLR